MSLLEKASEALRRGERSSALAFALEGVKYECSPSEAVELNRIAAEALLAQGQLSRARTYAEIARKNAHPTGDHRLAYSSAVTLGKVFARMNQYAAADQVWSEALTIAGVDKNPQLQGLVLLNMAILDQRRGNHHRALNTLQTVSQNFEKANALRPLAVCYGRMVFSFIEEGKTKDATSSSEKLEELAQRLEDKNLLAIAFFRKGSIYLKQDRFSEALSPFQESTELFRELGDLKNLALVLCDLARVYMNLEDMEKADSLLKEATGLAEEIESHSVLNAVQIAFADIAVLNDSWEKAKGYYHEALRKAEAINNEDRFRVLHESFGKSIRKLGLDIAGLEDLLVQAKEGYVRLGLTREAEETERWLAQIP
ncbi:MAG: hypothetical protein E3J71_01705 [Candidatus Stahlbacteria bacterium]|nr:MAG: hypothetical protein E3J71_01705 [Candidatus Stahlbacteria bacterium]